MANQESSELLSQLVDLVRQFSNLPECRNVVREMYVNLVRRVKLLSPLFEELKDSDQKLDDYDVQGFNCLKNSLFFGFEVVNSVNQGSKTFQALHLDKTIEKFHAATSQIEEALCKIHYDRFDIPQEVQEQVKVMSNKKVSELDVEFFEYKAEAKARMDALEKKIDDGIGKLEASIKAMKEEWDAKFEELKQLILGTAPSQLTHVDHVPQITKVAAKTAPYVPSIRRAYDNIGLELHNSNAESSTIMGKNLRPKYWDVEGSNKLDPGTTNDMNGFGREFGVDPQAAIDREMQHMGEQIFGAGLELIVGFDLRAFEGLNCDLGKGEERITWNPGIKHHPPRHILQVCYWPILHYKGNQRQSWDPGIMWLKILKEHLEDKIQLVHSQFKRAKGQVESPDLQLQTDLAMMKSGKEPDAEMVKRLSEKLHLTTINDLRRESLAIHDLVISTGGDLENSFETMSFILKKINDFVMLGNPQLDNSDSAKGFIRHRSPVIPDDFRCPISLELMKDPVIVSTGQTYERSCIQKWLDAGHKTCPKTQQTLLHTALTPNYVLKSLIALWCESNGIELRKSQGTSKTMKTGSECDQTAIHTLLEKLTNGNSDDQRAAVGELRLLAKRNTDNRICIAESGAIPLLVELLSSRDSRTQEHAVTALLNLSIHEANKGIIVSVGAIPEIVEVLKNGSMEARENAAATLFSLSAVDENKVAIGAAGAITPLIELLQNGTPRGKKDAATAIFNLCIYQGNKVRAVRAGVVTPLMNLVKDASGGMMDESLAILAIIAGHREGKVAIAQADPIPVLVEVVRTGSPRNRENGVAILWWVCAGDIECLQIMKEVGGEEVLRELSENGTDRAKRKARSVLELIQRVQIAEPVVNL
ncbi:U-box domain-containing protein 14 [Tanacetum coccineum]